MEEGGRSVLEIDEKKPGTEIAAETSAAMAASSIVFRNFNKTYATHLLNKAKLVHPFFLFSFSFFLLLMPLPIPIPIPFPLNASLQLFEFAKTHKGTFDGECPFYCSYSGYNVRVVRASVLLCSLSLSLCARVCVNLSITIMKECRTSYCGQQHGYTLRPGSLPI
ncbi:hypothetical protein CsSME_00037707 [Camellia sinensis var. sinensis]